MSEIETLVNIVRGEERLLRIAFASATLLLYDHAINLADEVSLNVNSYPYPIL